MSRRAVFGAGRTRLAKRPRRTIAATVAVLAALAALGVAAPAMATSIQHEFDLFAHCPLGNPEVNGCVYSTTTSGEFKIGNSTVPINKTIVLQGGLTEVSPFLDPGRRRRNPVADPTAGAGRAARHRTARQPHRSQRDLGTGRDRSKSTSRRSAPRKALAVVLPMKVKLDNPLLLNACYIGSDSEPIDTAPDDGHDQPAVGHAHRSPAAPECCRSSGAGKIDIFANNSLVDNTFPVPGANGCGGPLAPVVDLSVDLKEGLPAAPGASTAKLTGTLSEASATAVRRQREIPEFGHCVKAPAEKEGKVTVYHGLYINSGCTYESGLKLGKYEWIAGPGPNPKFSGSAKSATLETVGGSKIKCLESTNSGEYTGTKTATINVTFTGCARAAGAGATCQSAGASAGEVRAPGLQGTLGFVRDTAIEGVTSVSVGLDLTREPSLISAECGAGNESLVVTGSVIAPFGSIDKMTASNTLKLKASGGKQVPESFEEEAKDTLSETLGSIGPEQAGLTATPKFANQEKIEIKALAE